MNKKYTLERIEELVESEVSWWRYDKEEDVYMNCYTVSNYKQWGIYPRPCFDKEQDAREFFRAHLIKHYLL